MNLNDVYHLDLKMVVVGVGGGNHGFRGLRNWVPKGGFSLDIKLISYKWRHSHHCPHCFWTFLHSAKGIHKYLA